MTDKSLAERARELSLRATDLGIGMALRACADEIEWHQSECEADDKRAAAMQAEIDEARAEAKRLREALGKIRLGAWCDLTKAVNFGAVIDRHCPTCIAREALEPTQLKSGLSE